MSAKLGVLTIHGIGPHEPNFAEPMKAKLKRRISNYDEICWEPVRWADVLSEKEYKLWKRLFPEEKPDWFVEKLCLLWRILFPKKKLPHWFKEKRSHWFVEKLCLLWRVLFPEKKPPHWFKLRELVMNGIGDVTAYRSCSRS